MFGLVKNCLHRCGGVAFGWFDVLFPFLEDRTARAISVGSTLQVDIGTKTISAMCLLPLANFIWAFRSITGMDCKTRSKGDNNIWLLWVLFEYAQTFACKDQLSLVYCEKMRYLVQKSTVFKFKLPLVPGGLDVWVAYNVNKSIQTWSFSLIKIRALLWI